MNDEIIDIHIGIFAKTVLTYDGNKGKDDRSPLKNTGCNVK